MNIEQEITAYNDQRESVAATRSKLRRKHLIIFAALGIVLVAVGLWIYFSGSDPALYAVPFVGLLGLLLTLERLHRSANQPGKDLQKTVRERIFPALFSNIQDLRFQTNTTGFFDEAPDGIKPDTTKYCEGHDLIEGVYQGQSIAANEITVFGIRGHVDKHKPVEVFKGLALRIGLDHSVANLSVSSDPDAVQRLIMGQYRAVGNTEQLPFNDEHFETIYDVDCKNEGFADSVFSDAGRSTFMSLQGILSKSPIQLATTGSTAYVLVSKREDLFELPSIDRPFDTETDGQRLQNEMQGILDLIEGVRNLLKT